MDATISHAIEFAVSTSQKQILDSMQQMLDVRFQSFQDNVKQGQKEVSEAQLARIEESVTGSYTFQRKGNENQFKHNTKVLSKLHEAVNSLEEQKIDEAKDKIVEGMDMVKYRQKLVKLADSSVLGWKVVQEYEQNPLADNSDDEKKMTRATAAAERKQRARNRQRPYQRNPPAKESEKSSESSYRPGRCFSCGSRGHWAKECKSQEKKEANKISDSFLFIDIHGYNSTNVDCSGSVSSHVDVVSQGHTGEFNSNENIKIDSPVGRLKQNIDQWRSLTGNAHILDIIQSGYRLPMKTEPISIEIRNNKSALDNPVFVIAEISKLESKGCISEVSYIPDVVNPLTVAYNRSGKARLVLDARHINPHLFKFRYKYEDAATARQIFDTGDFLFTFDLKSAYHHIEIFPDHRNFLGFSYIIDGKKKFYIFNVLPFGISTAGYIFTKLTREVVKYFRSQGIKLVMYLDDGLGGSHSFDSACIVAEHISKCLQSLGFLLAEEKCCWLPNQTQQWLGFMWDMKVGKLRVTEDRMDRLHIKLDSVSEKIDSENLVVSVRFLAGIVGQIISNQPVFGYTVRLKTRHMYDCILSRVSWSSLVYLTKDAINEIKFWKENCIKLNNEGSYLNAAVKNPGWVDFDLYCDASDVGFGFYLAFKTGESLQDRKMSGSWLEHEMSQSSTWRELECIHRAVKSNLYDLKGKSLTIHTDNKNADHILRVGSKKMCLQDIACNIVDFCYQNHITFTSEWVPREFNTCADELSRTTDHDDWSIHDTVFDLLDLEWGHHSIDRFATHYNNKCLRFNSKYWCPGTEGVDAFHQFWGDEINWLVPPPILISEVVRKAVLDRASSTLIIPQWKSAPFWPLLFPDGFNAAYFIVDCKKLDEAKLIVKGRGNNGVFSQKPLKFIMLALKIRFL